MEFNGVVGVKSRTTLAEIRDGLSNTLLLAEKYLHPANLSSGTHGADNENLYVGLDNDTCRSTRWPPRTLRASDVPATFGSYHPGGMNAAMADGSLRIIAYSIQREVFRTMGNRYDNQFFE